jgi:hypothetical protein
MLPKYTGQYQVAWLVLYNSYYFLPKVDGIGPGFGRVAAVDVDGV